MMDGRRFTTRIRSIALAILVVLATLSFGPATVLAQTVSADDATVTAGDEASIDVTVDEFPEGLQIYNLTISIDDASVAEIDTVSGGAISGGSFQIVSQTATSVTIRAADFGGAVQTDASDVTLATVTLTDTTEGSTDIDVTVNRMKNDNGETIDPAVGSGTLTVNAADTGADDEQSTSKRTDRTRPTDYRLTAPTIIARPNNTVAVDFTIRNIGNTSDSATVNIDEADLPPDWTIAGVDIAGGATGSNVQRTIEQPRLAFTWSNITVGTTGTATLRLRLPANASSGTYTVSATAADGSGATDATANVSVVVEATSTTNAEQTAPGESLDRTAEDLTLTTDTPLYQGQRIVFDAESILGIGATPEQRTFAIRRLRGPNNRYIGPVVSEFTVSPEERKAVIRTRTLNGSYVLTHPATGYLVAIRNGTPTLAPAPTAAPRHRWTVQSQTLSARFVDADRSVATHTAARLRLTSNRVESYRIHISAESLRADTLAAIWGQQQEIAAVNSARDRITLRVSPEETLIANFSEFDTVGRYNFTVTAADTGVSDTATVRVTPRSGSMRIRSPRVTEAAGDIVDIPVRVTDDRVGWLFVAAPNGRFLERLKLVDNGDGTVTVRMNLFATDAGTDRTYTLANPADTIASVTDRPSVSVGSRGDSIGSAMTNASTPLMPGTYTIATARSPAVTINGSGEPQFPHATDTAALVVMPRQTTAIETLVAPPGPAVGYDLVSRDSASASLSPTPTDTVALGDRLLIRVNASGVYGYLENGTIPTKGGIAQTIPHPAGSDAVGLALHVRPTDTTQSTATALDLSTNQTRLYTVPTDDTFFIVVDTSALAPAVVGETVYNVTFSIYGPANADGPYRGPAARDNLGAAAPPDYPGGPNPYVGVDRKETVSTTVRFEPPTVTVTTPTRSGAVSVAADQHARIHGRTNVAPGTTLVIRLSSTQPSPFSRTQHTTVRPNGTFVSSFDLSTLPGGFPFTITISRGDEVLGQQRGMTTAAGTPDSTTSTTPGQPGFGIGIALIALIVFLGWIRRWH